MISLQRFAGMNCHYIRHSRDHFFASMEALGYERIELWAASPHYFAPHFSEAMVRALKADMARHGLSFFRGPRRAFAGAEEAPDSGAGLSGTLPSMICSGC